MQFHQKFPSILTLLAFLSFNRGKCVTADVRFLKDTKSSCQTKLTSEVCSKYANNSPLDYQVRLEINRYCHICPKNSNIFINES